MKKLSLILAAALLLLTLAACGNKNDTPAGSTANSGTQPAGTTAPAGTESPAPGTTGSGQEGSAETAMILIDLDHFKAINDTWGHEVGDLALQRLAKLLRESFRSQDYVCRIGGDEFAVIMLHANSSLKELVEAKMRRVNEIVQKPEGKVPAFTLSVGVAFGDRENPGEDLYKDADTALYRIKNNGRSGVAFY